jgi:preprotein translocase SecE subunit
VAKSRAQRKAEQRKRREQQQQGDGQAEAQHRTQVPESADVAEAELAEQGADLDELRSEPAEPEAPAPSRGEMAPAKGAEELPAEEPLDEEPAAEDRITRRERKRQERERKQAAKASVERRRPREEPVERERGRVMGFLASCVAELRRVQWPNRETLIQASAVTLVFIAVAAAYLGVLDGIFQEVVQLVL